MSVNGTENSRPLTGSVLSLLLCSRFTANQAPLLSPPLSSALPLSRSFLFLLILSLTQFFVVGGGFFVVVVVALN